MLPKLCLPQPTEDWLIYIPILIVSISTFLVIRNVRRSKVSIGNKVLLSIGISLIIGFPLLIVSFFVSLFILEPVTNHIASNYFVLNAAIKNTCYLDPQKKRCPTNLKELIAIEPQKLEPMIFGKSVTYNYYPQTNEYTLIIKHDLWRGVIFDPKLENFGGYDFIDISYSCVNANPEPSSPLNISKENWVQYLKERGLYN